MDTVELLVTAAIGGLIGGGTIAGLFYRALKDRLREDLGKAFAGIAFESVAIMAKDTADSNTDRIIALERSDSHASAHLAATLARIDRRLDQMDERHRQSQKEIDRTVALLDALERRMDRHAPHDR